MYIQQKQQNNLDPAEGFLQTEEGMQFSLTFLLPLQISTHTHKQEIPFTQKHYLGASATVERGKAKISSMNENSFHPWTSLVDLK